MLKGGERVLIVVDDYTRSTPVQEILPRLIKELQHAGVNKEDINILVALGTHRPMTEEEMVKKFGPKLSKQYPILN
ncbi:MAG: lactate racemase domain-containing protein, partial [Deltaproteobacteria bacterium]|nr:lactate racemase domain-containing protein [Deltaproteobacteria bacterium]